MSSISSRDRRRTVLAVKESLRVLRNQLSLLHHQVSAAVEVKDIDLDCLELIQRLGPISPSALARTAGLHPATLTGILDRLQRGQWIVRERDPHAADRRAVTVRALPGRNGELFRQYAGMNTAMDALCADYTDAELELVAEFLRRTTEAGRQAATDLAEES